MTTTTSAADRPCSLRRRLHIEPANLAAWRELAEFHYRDHRPGVVDRVFAARLGRAPGAVAVIVYGMPVPDVALRNLATGGRYVGWPDQAAALRLLNEEVRCINRVVVRPEFRGIGVARWLVAETLPQAGAVLVEALAVMGRVNPFFERAGMRRYEAPLAAAAQRVLAALDRAGVGSAATADAAALVAALRALPAPQRAWLRGELERFARLHTRRTAHTAAADIRRCAELVVRHARGKPAYFLWKLTQTATNGGKLP